MLVKPKPFPQEKLKACEVFNAEWLQRRFTKQELADAIEQILAEIAPPPRLKEVDAQTTLVLPSRGTFLTNDTHKFDIAGEIKLLEEEM